MYELTKDKNTVVRTEDGTAIPRGHRWWLEYEDWLKAGHVAVPFALDEMAQKREEINAWADKKMLAGFEYDGHRYQSDIESREALMRTVIAGLGSPTGYWLDVDNQRVDVKDHATIVSMYNALQAFSDQVFCRKQAMKEEILQLQGEALKAYQVS